MYFPSAFDFLKEIKYVGNWIIQFKIVNIFVWVMYRIYMFLFVTPLFYFYLNGPSFVGYGFWGGKSHPEICAGLSYETPEFWARETNKLDCEEKILRNFGSWMTSLFIITYGIIFLNCMWVWCCFPIRLPRQTLFNRPINISKLKRKRKFSKRKLRSSSSSDSSQGTYSPVSSEESH